MLAVSITHTQTGSPLRERDVLDLLEDWSFLTLK